MDLDPTVFVSLIEYHAHNVSTFLPMSERIENCTKSVADPAIFVSDQDALKIIFFSEVFFALYFL